MWRLSRGVCTECHFCIYFVLQVAGLFWNYFSIGMDAASAHRFHALREARPWATSGRHVNQFWYTYFGFATGWMLGATPIRDKVGLKVITTGTCSMPCQTMALPASCMYQDRGSSSIEGPTVTMLLHVYHAQCISA